MYFSHDNSAIATHLLPRMRLVRSICRQKCCYGGNSKREEVEGDSVLALASRQPARVRALRLAVSFSRLTRLPMILPCLRPLLHPKISSVSFYLHNHALVAFMR
jgi:hypothetical protein